MFSYSFELCPRSLELLPPCLPAPVLHIQLTTKRGSSMGVSGFVRSRNPMMSAHWPGSRLHLRLRLEPVRLCCMLKKVIQGSLRCN
jgi:hypothetical protein